MNPRDSEARQELRFQYLLGELAEAARDRLEEECLLSSDAVAEMDDAENELIRRYVAGELEPARRRRFETAFAITPERQRAVAAERMLAGELGRLERTLASHRPAEASGVRFSDWWRSLFWGWQVGWSAAAVALLGCNLWLASRAFAPHAAPVELAQTDVAWSRDLVQARSGEESPARVAMRADAPLVSVNVTVAQGERFRAALLRGTEPVWVAGDLQPASVNGGRTLVLLIPRARIVPGESYRLVWQSQDGGEPAQSLSVRFEAVP